MQRNQELASYIDHTLLKPDASQAELLKLCQEAKDHHFKGVCVNSRHIAFVSQALSGTTVLPISVIGFPLGAVATDVKAFEAKSSIEAGAQEIDMVVAIGALKDKNYDYVAYDIAKVVEASRPYPVKVILETSMLTDEEKIIACVLAKLSGAQFVKTSTGFSGGGATVKDIELMRRIVGSTMSVKASGGVRTAADAIKMIEAGATRIGTSHGLTIIGNDKPRSYGY